MKRPLHDDEIKVVPFGQAETRVSIGERQGVAGLAIAKPLIPGDVFIFVFWL